MLPKRRPKRSTRSERNSWLIADSVRIESAIIDLDYVYSSRAYLLQRSSSYIQDVLFACRFLISFNNMVIHFPGSFGRAFSSFWILDAQDL